MARFFLGLILGIVLIPFAVWVWFEFGHPPVAVSDSPLPFERVITHVPLNARIHGEMVKNPPIQADENNLIAGAQIYRDQCSACHGYWGKHSSFGAHMFPRAPQLFDKHKNGAIGVSDDPAGETEWKVANGIRLTGMPSYKSILNDTQMWQVSLALANADKLPPAAMDAVKPPVTQAEATQQPGAKTPK